ncbi:MAG: hypothetical protein CMM61_11120 [Rhodospirillaceae bacterium]|nr:hypothetical protein [Rhodospirillaceae bacterium]
MTRADPEREMQAAVEARLRESERRLSELQRIANLGSWDWDVAADTFWWSDQIYRIFGLDPADFKVTSEALLDRVHPDDERRVRAAMTRAIKTGVSFDIEHRIVLPYGGIRCVRERGETVRDEAGAVVRMFGTVQDVTERRDAEQALRRSESRLAAIIETAPEAVIVTDRDGNIQVFNRGAEAIFGFTAEEAEGQSLDILIPAHKRADHQLHMRLFTASGSVRRMMDMRREISGLRKDGTVFPAAASVSKIDIDGDMIFVAILRDVSDLKQVERNLRGALADAEKANRAKSEFLATMSHELRTPLNAILGFSEILNGEYLGPVGTPKYLEYAEHIHESGQYLLSLVNDLLDFSAIEDGRRKLEIGAVCLLRVIQDCVNIVRPKVEEKGIDLLTNIAPGMRHIPCDRRAVQQILLNLLSNSIKFTPSGGTVQVSCLALEQSAQITVADTGCGIPADVLPQVTSPFRSLAKNPYRAEKGWGLGLPISKSLVDLHGGTMRIESEEGKGTTITVSFPLVRQGSGDLGDMTCNLRTCLRPPDGPAGGGGE